MPGIGAFFHDYLTGPWEQAAPYVREELEQLRAGVNAMFGRAFRNDDVLNPDFTSESLDALDETD